jgi:hypothetical protein
VWLTEGARRIVKLLDPRGDPGALRRQLAFVRRLDLTGLHVARPISVLRPPHVGYVAEFLGDMVAIKSLFYKPPPDLLRWHVQTGGLRRRLRLLAHAGEALMGLHALGVVYADVSPDNLFVSAPTSAVEAWLIDLDNLSYESDPRRAIYTHKYGAPEVVNATAGCTSLSDAWSFAVLVWQTLTLTHPFVGDAMNDGKYESEDEAYAGKWPWVRHSSDERNRCSAGLPPELVMGFPPTNKTLLSKRKESTLLHLARRTFEDGLTDRKARPGVSAWVEALHGAADKSVLCSGCGGTFLMPVTACPWCDEPPPLVAPVRLTWWQPDKGLIEERKLDKLPLTGQGLVLTRRTTMGLPGLAGREAHVELIPVARGLSIRAMPDSEVWVALRNQVSKARHLVSTRITVPTGEWLVLFQNPDKPQYVAVIGRSS